MDEIEAVAVWHEHIRDHEIEPPLLHRGAGVDATLRGDRGISRIGEPLLQQGANCLFVVNDQGRKWSHAARHWMEAAGGFQAPGS